MNTSSTTKTIRVKADIHDLIIAADSHGGFMDQRAYLDTERGEVVVLTGDEQHYLDEEHMGVLDLADDQVFARFVTQNKIPDWIAHMVQHAWCIEYGDRRRYLELPKKMTAESYDHMRRFIYTLEDERMIARLEDAIAGKGAFRRFKDTIRRTEAVEQAWHAFKNQREEEWMLEWLEESGIELIPE